MTKQFIDITGAEYIAEQVLSKVPTDAEGNAVAEGYKIGADIVKKIGLGLAVDEYGSLSADVHLTGALDIGTFHIDENGHLIWSVGEEGENENLVLVNDEDGNLLATKEDVYRMLGISSSSGSAFPQETGPTIVVVDDSDGGYNATTDDIDKVINDFSKILEGGTSGG